MEHVREKRGSGGKRLCTKKRHWKKMQQAPSLFQVRMHWRTRWTPGLFPGDPSGVWEHEKT